MKIKEKARKAKTWVKEHKAIVGGAIGATIAAVIDGFAIKTLLDKHAESMSGKLDDCMGQQCQIGYNGKDVPALLQVLSDDEAAFWVDPKELTNKED